jgi:hypothetical protein
MAGPLRRVVILLALACSPALAQQVDPNLQSLLTALMQGTPITLLTPLSDGTIQVTSFTAPGQRNAADAALLIQQARVDLQNLGVTRPTGQQLAAALAGGTINVPTGSTQLPGVLPRGTAGVTLNSQIVNAANLPTIIGASPAGVSAATGAAQAGAGGSVPILTTPTPFIR